MRSGLESSSVTIPRRAKPATRQTTPMSTASAEARAMALGGVAVGADQRQDGGEDHRRERRVRAQHEDARRPEQRVGEQGEDRGVEAGHRRQTGQLGVGHALRHQQGGDREARDEVAAQVSAAIVAERPQTRQPAEQARSAALGRALIDHRFHHGRQVYLSPAAKTQDTLDRKSPKGLELLAGV